MDAFDVTSDGTAPPPARFEETDPSVAFTGTWTTNTDFVAWSGGSAAVSNEGLARGTFSFTGAAVSWISVRCEICGIAKVFVDGTPEGEIDTFSPTRVQEVVFTATFSTGGSHTLVIEVTGTKNSASGDAFVAVDAFDVTP